MTLVRKIRETDKTLPLIMGTTEAEKSKVIEAINAGVNNYLVKPFTSETLKATVEATMAKVGAGVS
ncbi:MAG: response regulator [Planctomycetes bacterium]|nr:response regulator [Planctomycetota bacterium]